MENLDDIIGKTLGSLDNIQSVEAPDAFSDKVMARISQRKKGAGPSGFMFAMAAAIALLIAVNAYTWVKTGSGRPEISYENDRVSFAKTYGILDQQGGIY